MSLSTWETYSWYIYPALNLSTLEAGILIMVQYISLIMSSLNMVDYPMSFLSLHLKFVLLEK